MRGREIYHLGNEANEVKNAIDENRKLIVNAIRCTIFSGYTDINGLSFIEWLESVRKVNISCVL